MSLWDERGEPKERKKKKIEQQVVVFNFGSK